MDVEARTGRLYGLSPEQFVAARDELARALRGAGERQAAARVAGLRRPTVAAWAVNQAARRRPELVGELLQAGERLREAQRRALSGLHDSGLRAAGAERRAAVERLLAVAAGVLEEAGRAADAHRDTIAATLQAASVDEAAATAVRSGTLGRELAAPTGFDEAAGLGLVEPPPPAPATAPATEPARRRPKLDAARRRRLQAARRRRDDLRRKAQATARTATRAREEAEATRERAEAAEAAARTAREALELADQEVTDLEAGG